MMYYNGGHLQSVQGHTRKDTEIYKLSLASRSGGKDRKASKSWLWILYSKCSRGKEGFLKIHKTTFMQQLFKEFIWDFQNSNWSMLHKEERT